MTMNPEPRSYRSREAAEILGVSRVTLQKWRREGSGPRFLKRGKVILYPADGLAEFLAHDDRGEQS